MSEPVQGGVKVERPENMSPKRVWLQEDECERLNRGEFEAIRSLLGAVSYTAHANDDLQKRLEMLPYGKQRMRMLVGGLRAMADDLIGTVPRGQCKQLRNTMQDMEMRMVPKLTGMTQNVIFEKDLAKGLIDAAMEKCRGCVEDSVGCRKCGLYKVLEGMLPLDNYGDGMICPYSVSEWED